MERLRLAGKHAVVTAAGQGIGRATALAMAAEGAHVHACYIDDALLATLPVSESVTPVRLDACSAAEVAALVGQVGDVDILFNGVGMVHVG